MEQNVFDINLQKYVYSRLAIFSPRLLMKGANCSQYYRYDLSPSTNKTLGSPTGLLAAFSLKAFQKTEYNIRHTWKAQKKLSQIKIRGIFIQISQQFPGWPHTTSFHLFFWPWESTYNNFYLKGGSYIWSNMRKFSKQQK